MTNSTKRRNLILIIAGTLLVLLGFCVGIYFHQNNWIFEYHRAFDSSNTPYPVEAFTKLLKETGNVSKVEYLEPRSGEKKLEIWIYMKESLDRDGITELLCDTIFPALAVDNTLYAYFVKENPSAIELHFKDNRKDFYACGSTRQSFIPFEIWGNEESTYYLQDFRTDSTILSMANDEGSRRDDVLSIYQIDKRIRYFDPSQGTLYVYDAAEDELPVLKRQVQEKTSFTIQELLVSTRVLKEIDVNGESLKDSLEDRLDRKVVKQVAITEDMNSELRIRIELFEPMANESIDDLMRRSVFPWLASEENACSHIFEEASMKRVFVEFHVGKEVIAYFYSNQTDSFGIWNREWYEGCPQRTYDLEDFK